jgi:hypothetical protein
VEAPVDRWAPGKRRPLLSASMTCYCWADDVMALIGCIDAVVIAEVFGQWVILRVDACRLARSTPRRGQMWATCSPGGAGSRRHHTCDRVALLSARPIGNGRP